MARRERIVRRERRARFVGVVIGMVSGVLVCGIIASMVSYIEARADQKYCEAEGWEVCQIEFDGLISGFNLYYK